MGYETIIMVGWMPDLDYEHQKVVVRGSFYNQPRGAAFTVCKNDQGREIVYLPDGDSQICISNALKDGRLERLPENNWRYFAIIATIDMSKIGSIQSYLKEDDVLARHPEFYLGHHQYVEDLYGDRLVAYKLQAVIDILKKLTEEDKNQYWRYSPALQFLQTVAERAWQPNLSVVLYGH